MNAILEECRLELVWHIGRCHRAVPMTLDVCAKTLFPAPTHTAQFPGGDDPIAIAIKDLPEALCRIGAQQVDKRIAQTNPRFEIHWQIKEIVLSREAFGIDEVQH